MTERHLPNAAGNPGETARCGAQRIMSGRSGTSACYARAFGPSDGAEGAAL